MAGRAWQWYGTGKSANRLWIQSEHLLWVSILHSPPRSNNTFYVFLPSGAGGQIIFANLAPITGSSCPAGVKLRAGVFWVGFKRPPGLKPNTQETIQNYFKIDVLF